MSDSEPKKISRRQLLIGIGLVPVAAAAAAIKGPEIYNNHSTYFYEPTEAEKIMDKYHEKIMLPGISILDPENSCLLKHGNFNILIGANNSFYVIDENYNIAIGSIETTANWKKTVYIKSQRWQEDITAESLVSQTLPEKIPLFDLQYTPGSSPKVLSMNIYPISGQVAGDGNMTEYDPPSTSFTLNIPENIKDKLPKYYIN